MHRVTLRSQINTVLRCRMQHALFIHYGAFVHMLFTNSYQITVNDQCFSCLWCFSCRTRSSLALCGGKADAALSALIKSVVLIPLCVSHTPSFVNQKLLQCQGPTSKQRSRPNGPMGMSWETETEKRERARGRERSLARLAQISLTVALRSCARNPSAGKATESDAELLEDDGSLKNWRLYPCTSNCASSCCPWALGNLREA